jgi:hypothetical protein
VGGVRVDFVCGKPFHPSLIFSSNVQNLPNSRIGS